MKATVIIPNYNGKHFLKPCLDALSKQTFSSFEIIIVDNASTDGSLEFLDLNYPEIKTISLEENYGFSKAVNIGIKNAKTPYVILLNNDTEPAADYIDYMVKAIEKSPEIFSVSSKMIQMYHPEFIDSAGDLYTVLGWAICRGTGRPVSNYTTADTIFSACAGAAIYRRNVFKKIGYFDEAHFAYLEDVDIGYRAKIYGYKNTYCPDALVYHVGSGTSGSKYNSFKVKMTGRNNLYLNYKNMPLLQIVFNSIPLFLGFLIKYLFFVKIGFGKDYLEGAREGLRNLKKQKKVPFRINHLPNYFSIEAELIKNTVFYAKDWFSRKIFKR